MSEIVGTIPAKQTAVGSIGTVYGKDGLSAYQIALKNGFAGTEEKWLESLKGPQGEPGKDGKDAEPIICEATGSVITLKDSSERELQGLKIYGNTTESGSVGDSGSVEIKVMGKNVYNYVFTQTGWVAYGSILEVLGANGIIVKGNLGSEPGSNSSTNGWLRNDKTAIALRAGDTVTVSCDYTTLERPEGVTPKYYGVYLYGPNNYTKIARYDPLSVGQKIRLSATHTITKSGNYYPIITLNSCKVQIENIQISYSTSTDYEPYKEPQTLTVSTPNGLQTGEVLEVADANTLHTYKPNTTIINDAGAEMSVEYVADTKNFVLNEIQKAIAESVATLTALTGV